MQVPLSWIKKYTDLKDDQDLLLSKIASQLGAIEHIEDYRKKYEGVLIGQIEEKNEHPNADKLGVYKLNIGDRTVQVVAGDKTLQIGDKVAYFPPGTKVASTVGTAEEFVVKKVDLRGVESEGMMASEKEIDLGANHLQVMRLDTESPAGTRFAQEYGLDTVVVDVENKALANRGDCFGLIGIAREISGIQGLKFQAPQWLSDDFAKITEDDRVPLNIRNEAGPHCPRYMAVVMDGVQLKDSPVWLKALLTMCGVRPINNIVDITNYLMLLTSQPLHAFDYDKVIGKDMKSKNVATIVIRPSRQGEKITTLDGKTVELPEGVTVIADSENPIGIAGIMGGQDTEIDSNTKRIIIECANFDRYNIRRSSMKLGLFTEAVTRFTKALAPEMCDRVLAESTRLIAQLSGAAVASVVKDDYASPANPVSVKVSIPRMNAHLGTALSQNEATTLLENISYTVDVEDADHIIVHVPYFRKDVTLPQDINEDIGRQYGYNNIKVTLPTRSVLPASTNRSLQLKQKIREILSGNGLNEILTYNFTGKDHFLKAGLSIESAYHIKNSLSPELEYMRYSLIPSILEKAYENEKSGYTQFGLYEINAGHNKEEMDEEKLPLERWLVSLVLVTPSETPYYQVKVYTDLLAQKLNLRQVDYVLLADTPTTQLPAWIQRILPAFDMNRSAVILSTQKEKEYIGVVGEVSSSAKAAFGIKQGAAVAEIDISALGALMMHGSSYVEPSRFPAVSQDLCFAVKMDVPYEQLRREILSALEDTNLRIKVEPLDIYQPKDAQDRKQITFTVSIQHTEKTLQPKDIQHLREKVVKKVSKKFDAKLI